MRRRRRRQRLGRWVCGAGDCGRGAAAHLAAGRARAGTGAVPAGLGVGPCAARPASRAPSRAPWVHGSLPPARCSPQPPPPSPGTKRLQGGAEPAALAGASGDGRAPSSDSSGQPPIRPREAESPRLASSALLPPDPRALPGPPPASLPGLPLCPQPHTPSFPARVPGRGRRPPEDLAKSLPARVPAGRGSSGSWPG